MSSPESGPLAGDGQTPGVGQTGTAAAPATYGPADMPPKPAKAGEAATLRYLESYSYVFRSPDWGMNVLSVALCQFIPIVGPMVVWGYQFEIIDALQRDPDKIYPKFEFNRFVDYLKRGVWPFLVGFILGAIMTPFMFVLQIFMMIGMAALENADESAAIVLGVIIMGAFFFGIFALSLAIWLLTVPMSLRAGLAQDLGECFRFGWIKDFVARVWKELLLAALFLGLSAMIFGMAGLALCCIGVYPAVAVVMLAQAHLYWQLYRLHQNRGGEAVKPKLAEAAPPAWPSSGQSV